MAASSSSPRSVLTSRRTSKRSVWTPDTIRTTAGDEDCWPVVGALAVAEVLMLVLNAADKTPMPGVECRLPCKQLDEQT